MPTPNSQHYDVIIAGAHCAGAATAMLLDRSRYGTDTLSTRAHARRGALKHLVQVKRGSV